VGVENYPNSNAPQISSAALADNLLINSGATLTVTSAGSLTADGDWINFGMLANSGVLQQTQAIAAGQMVSFFADGNYGGVDITAHAADNLGSTTAIIRGNRDCTSPVSGTIQRCFDLAPTNQPVNGATVTFAFNDAEIPVGNTCTNVDAFHYQGSGNWGSALTRDAIDCSGDPNTITVSGVTSMSPFALKDSSAPTAVTLQSFTAGSSSVLLLFATLVVVLAGLSAVVIFHKRQK
jgi:hypothetical protein